MVAVLLSMGADQYCMGVAKPSRSDPGDLQKLVQRFAKGTVWRFPTVHLHENEKPQFIHTRARIAIDLRASKTTKLLQSAAFPDGARSDY